MVIHYFVEVLEFKLRLFPFTFIYSWSGSTEKLTVPKKKLQYIAIINLDRVINPSISLAILTGTMYY